MKTLEKLLALMLALALTFTLALPSFAAPTTTEDTSTEETEEDSDRPIESIVASYNNPNGRVISVARFGNPRIYPEDSLTGIQSCMVMGVDAVSFSVQETSDGALILMEDSTIGRMLVNKATHEDASGKVSDYTLEQLQEEYVLRERSGGEHNDPTEEAVPSLANVLSACKNNVMVYIKNGWKYAKKINQTARENDCTDIVIIGGATDTEAVSSFISKQGTPICHIAASFVDGESDGSAKNFAKDAMDAGATTVLMASSKNYSAIFKSATLRKFQDNGRAMISATDFDLDGERKDSIEGWEELIDCGYSVIETDYPKELTAYLDSIESYRATLTSLITQAQTLDESAYSKYTYRQMTYALEEAQEVSSLGAVSLQKIDSARYDLQESIDALEHGTEVPKEHTPVWVIILIVAAVLLVIALLVILGMRLFNRRKKYHKQHDKVLRRFKAQSEKNLAVAKTEVDQSDKPITTAGSGDNILDNLGGDKDAAALAAKNAEVAAAEAARKAAEKPEKPEKPKKEKKEKVSLASLKDKVKLPKKKKTETPKVETKVEEAPKEDPKPTTESMDPSLMFIDIGGDEIQAKPKAAPKITPAVPKRDLSDNPKVPEIPTLEDTEEKE